MEENTAAQSAQVEGGRLRSDVTVLYCHACEKNHWFKVSDVERIVYTGVGTYVDLHLDGVERIADGQVAWPCLKAVLAESHDIEGYAEHVEEAIESRTRLATSEGNASTPAPSTPCSQPVSDEGMGESSTVPKEGFVNMKTLGEVDALSTLDKGEDQK
jgi:hypothetical protein